MRLSLYYLARVAPLAVLALAAAPAYAATLSLSPTYNSVAAGDTVSIQVVVNAQGAPLVTSQIQLSYPPDLLEPISFTFAPNWTQTFDIGTNVMSGGTVVQAGGHQPPFTGMQMMGTLTFAALKAGVATVVMSGGNSYLFETDGGNMLAGPLASAQVRITPGSGAVNVQSNAVASPTESTAAAASSAAPSSNTQAAAGGSLFSIIPHWAWAALVALVLIVIGWRVVVSKKRQRKKRRR